MKKTALVIMAAGIGSRFGKGIKQLAPVGPEGEIIMDYSIHDALEAGFNKVVFIIRKDLEEEFRKVIGERIEKITEVEYAFQELDDLPEGQQVTFIETAPMTNLALLLRVFPEVKDKIRRIVFMGGAVKGGNVTPAAEFNIYADPEAAKIVFEAGIPLVMCGLDATMKCNLTRNQIMKLCQSGNPVARACGDMAGYVLENSSKYRCVASIHDAVPFMYLLHPEFFKMEKAILDVDCSDGAGRGAMLCDFRWWLHDEEKIKDMILTDADTESFQQELFEAIYSVTGQKA